MRNSAISNTSSDVRRQPHTLAVVWRWLIEPAATLSDPERRRSRALAIIVLLLLFSAGLYLVSIFISTEADLRGPYTILIGSLLSIFALALGLNRTGYYSAAAGLLVACMVLGPWYSILLNFTSLSSDVMRLSYIAVSVLLCSFFFPTRVTVVLAISQLAALGLVSLVSPVLTATNWPSVLGFIMFMSLLSIVSNFISRRDLAQIDQQTRQLFESEARLRELSIRDPLTGLFNRRYLDETLDRELSRAARKQLPLSIIMMDIDHFKRFNDAYGHAAGDVLLRRVGDSLQGHIRAADIACRYGGEEFILVLPEASREVTRERAEQVREEVKGLRVDFKDQTLEAVTLSLGVAVFPLNGSTSAAVMKAADAALYQAKREGRDRVIVAN